LEVEGAGLDSFSPRENIFEGRFSEGAGADAGAGFFAESVLEEGAAGLDTFSSRVLIFESQVSEGVGAGGSGGSMEVFGRLRIMSPRKSDIQSVASVPDGGAAAEGLDSPGCTGFKRAPQYLQASASCGFGFPHIGQRRSAITSAPGSLGLGYRP
jgi:hypothetical protein